MDEFIFWFASAKRDKGILYYSELTGYVVPMFSKELHNTDDVVIIDFREIKHGNTLQF